MPTDFGFRLLLVITVLVGASVIWVGVQTGDWTGLVLVVPLAVLIPVVAKLPSEPPRRRRPKPDEPQTPGSASARDDEPRRY
jgi:hypothetical protein